jgi:Rrf2 family protein
MSASIKLITAVQVLNYLAEIHPQSASSNQIAGVVGYNASRLRQLMPLLVQAGLLNSSRGKEGGFSIIENWPEIHLQAVYCAVEEQKAFQMTTKLMANHPENNFNKYFLSLFSDVQILIENHMKNITLGQIRAEINKNTSL